MSIEGLLLDAGLPLDEHSYTTIWSGRAVRAALTVKVVDQSSAAIKFLVPDSLSNATFWLPKKALRMVDGQYDLAFWFVKGDYLRGLFDRYATHYRG